MVSNEIPSIEELGKFLDDNKAFLMYLISQSSSVFWDDPEDIYQDCCVRWLSRFRGDEYKDAKKGCRLAYVKEIARNLIRDRIRKKNLPLQSLDPDQDQLEDSRRDSPCEFSELLDLIKAHLRPEEYETFFAYHIEQMSPYQIAERLKRPLGTIKTWLQRIPEKLRSVRAIRAYEY